MYRVPNYITQGFAGLGSHPLLVANGDYSEFGVEVAAWEPEKSKDGKGGLCGPLLGPLNNIAPNTAGWKKETEILANVHYVLQEPRRLHVPSSCRGWFSKPILMYTCEVNT